ncbi:FkbM family methyltransferase [Caldivirga maquilingensis]|uniref:Methyltransferase FkbM family n=1 Tax=Caldivirga maquilingensis (strain ATCC 700844 / DSM 13496 / JCM 10307 / IC-167) TaxID=397948 RepID=A8M975_CALMQ|nr:FkbM family methyltransferase [Caldivirga maquilingensis]ABW02294.1 methyltransferase FkbM family [Caldivirga maquilingensis IC-167]
MIKAVLNSIRTSMVNKYPLDLALANLTASISALRRLGVYPRVVHLPDGNKIIVNNIDTLLINVPDQFVRREYALSRDFIPKPNWIVLDVGAYVGIYSLWAAKLIGNGGFVVSFEPNPLAYQWLVRNIEVNGVSNIHAIPLALGDYIGRSRLYVALRNIEASSFIQNHITRNPTGDLGIARSFTVPIITLDAFIRHSRAMIGRAIDHIDLVKIDVEGYEARVLRGAQEALNKGFISRFVIEVHIDQVKTMDIISMLKGYDYRAVGIKNVNNVKHMLYAELIR